MSHDLLLGIVLGLGGFTLILLLIVLFCPQGKAPGGW